MEVLIEIVLPVFAVLIGGILFSLFCMGLGEGGNNRNKCNINSSETIYSNNKLNLNELTYSDLLKQPEGQEKRQEILKRDNYKCCYCGSTDKLCVHHKYYLQYPNHEKVKPWNYPDDALITLCNKCHYKVHKRKPIKVYYKKYE